MKRLVLGVLSLLIIINSQKAWADSTVVCNWEAVHHPHISSTILQRTGKIFIKTAGEGRCEAVPDPVDVTAQITLEKQGFLGLYGTFAVGDPITKSIQGNPRSWKSGELFAVAPCEPGTYRGRLHKSAFAEDGSVVLGQPIDGLTSGVPIDCQLKWISMVIDDTGSMSDDIGRVASALTSYINSQPEDEYTKWSLTTFKDSPTNVGTTEDRSQILSMVSALTASGGGDCPEDVLGGISTGLSALGNDSRNNRQMLVATDASAQAGDVDGIIANARANGVRVNVLLRGDCGLSSAARTTASALVSSAPLSSQVVLKRIADETGGKYFFLAGATDDQIKDALNEIFSSFVNPTPVDTVPPVLQLSVTPTTIFPPNHKWIEVVPVVTATDNLDPNPKVEFIGVEVSEPEDGQGDGHTIGDVEIMPDGRIFVRAERSAHNNGRVYTITYRATDASGNSTFASATVVVPKSRR